MSIPICTALRISSDGVRKYAVYFFRRVQSSTQEKNIQVVTSQTSLSNRS